MTSDNDFDAPPAATLRDELRLICLNNCGSRTPPRLVVIAATQPWIGWRVRSIQTQRKAGLNLTYQRPPSDKRIGRVTNRDRVTHGGRATATASTDTRQTNGLIRQATGRWQ